MHFTQATCTMSKKHFGKIFKCILKQTEFFQAVNILSKQSNEDRHVKKLQFRSESDRSNPDFHRASIEVFPDLKKAPFKNNLL